jgi:ATP-dependent helicase HrpA
MHSKKFNQTINERIKNLPNLTYDSALPITAKKDDIINAVRRNQVLIISGDTGSGKTTQIPKFCLEAGRGINGFIGCTQPRRIAASTVARRIAGEFGEEPGLSVGYKIRFKDRTSKNSYIKIMTDGILLAETRGDPQLWQYDTIIIDEAHERSLNIDFILGILKKLLIRRKALKLIITSATIDTEKFSKAFGNAPVIEVSGRMYPVEVRYWEIDGKEDDDARAMYVEAAAKAVNRLAQEGPFGDMLVFMPTEQDIRETCTIIQGQNHKGTIVLPLFARLSGYDQHKVFSQIPGRKIIVATNIAETSITIPGIKYVVDTGLARISRYSPGTRITSLPIVRISQSSADQRKGRAGRVKSGICVRLYSEEDYQNRPLFTLPEILRTNLAEVILRMMALKLGHVSSFPFVDPPAEKSVRDGFGLLSELGAIKKQSRAKSGNSSFSLTKTGKLMAKLPVDPRLSRMLIEARRNGCEEQVAIIASALSVRDPRERPLDKAAQADQMHAKFRDPLSDFITLFNIWKEYQTVLKKQKTLSSVRKMCRKSFLSFNRMREWQDIYSQISSALEEYNIIDSKKPAPEKTASEKQTGNAGNEFGLQYTQIHKSILSGFLSNIALKKQANLFLAAKGKEIMIFPGSGLFNKAGTWIVCAQQVETSRLFARITANIDPAWIELIGKKQCKYTYLSPHWEKNRGQVVASQQVSLYGLIFVQGRPVSYGKINPDEANEIFLRALVDGDIKEKFGFIAHNHKLIHEIQDMENRLRRRDVLVSDEDMIAFYREHITGIYDIRSFQKYIKDKGNDNFLRMKRQDLLNYEPGKEELSLFPDNVVLGERSFSCKYKFNPKKHDDGLTVKVSWDQASSLPEESLDWLVPGLYREKITVLIKSLPKTFRKHLAPVSSTVDILINEMPKQKTSLITALRRFIFHRFNLDIPESAWKEKSLGNHLKTRILITGPKGEKLRSGRDKKILKQSVPKEIIPDEIQALKDKWEINNITKWDMDDVPEFITLKLKTGKKWSVYPGFRSRENDYNGGKVSLRLFGTRHEALAFHIKGVAVLFCNHLAKELRFLKKQLILPESVCSGANYFGGAKSFQKRLYENVVKNLCSLNIRTKKEFDLHVAQISQKLLKHGREILSQSISVVQAYADTCAVFDKLAVKFRFNAAISDFLETLRKQLADLVPENFVQLYHKDTFQHIVRYIKAAEIRAQRGVVSLEKDIVKQKQVQIFSENLNSLVAQLSPDVTKDKQKAVEDFFWLLQEYKVSVFAQELKTPVPVSKKRLEKKLELISGMV